MTLCARVCLLHVQQTLSLLCLRLLLATCTFVLHQFLMILAKLPGYPSPICLQTPVCPTYKQHSLLVHCQQTASFQPECISSRPLLRYRSIDTLHLHKSLCMSALCTLSYMFAANSHVSIGACEIKSWSKQVTAPHVVLSHC